MITRRIKEMLSINLLRLLISISIMFLILFLYLIFSKGIGVIDWTFLTQKPLNGMTEGGIFPAILGTMYLTVMSLIIAFPLGVMASVYLAEYGKPRWIMTVIRTAINTLAGVPSIVYGLFGLAIFVNMFNMGVSILSGSLTLAILILPIIINASEEAIKQVPSGFREAAFALGATKSQVIMKVILPAALPNILTGAIISVGRAAGETAPILFTAATFYTGKLPQSVMDEVMALPYHIYALMTEGTAPDKQVPIAYGTAVILLLL
ncbi:MAG: phosphate ABC transporter permease PstA, partial [candidate division WOR-3 bacterium]|nr:phosphate ABC transporter permease PstA [candidate division WOR-3 bacterium]